MFVHFILREIDIKLKIFNIIGTYMLYILGLIKFFQTEQ